ncbi:hypothetical protein BDR05DRAFT_952817 [Suillus weaverae]|nr:hypothetical protein BDR05DRAFT_952817 [Suillus weaverae]
MSGKSVGCQASQSDIRQVSQISGKLLDVRQVGRISGKSVGCQANIYGPDTVIDGHEPAIGHSPDHDIHEADFDRLKDTDLVDTGCNDTGQQVDEAHPENPDLDPIGHDHNEGGATQGQTIMMGWTDKYNTIYDCTRYTSSRQLLSIIMPPRFKYNLQGLDPKEKQAEQKRRWLARQMQDPESAERIRAQNRASKQAQQHREKMSKESPKQGAEPPRFRRKKPATTSSGVPFAQHSTSAVPPATSMAIDDSLIDPVLRSPVPPRHMVDADVMTDPPQIIPDTTQLLSAPNLDFISGILGVEVPQQSGMVTWADGRRTVLPCIMSKGIDICEDNDGAMVRFLSEFPESKPTSNNTVHLTRDGLTRGQLQQSIGEALLHNKPVIIRGSSSDSASASALDAEYLETNFGISPLMRVTMHGESAPFVYPTTQLSQQTSPNE